MEIWIIACFWSSVALLAYTFVGYPALMIMLAKIRTKPAAETQTPNEWPTLSVVIAMSNEAERAKAKIDELFDDHYPKDKLEVIVVLDAPTDETEDVLRRLTYPNLILNVRPERAGKSSCLNHGVGDATGEIILFCDARQRFRAHAIRNLARHFVTPSVGAVSGELIIEGGELGAYWKLEKAIRKAESRLGSVIGCTGAIYAIRRKLFDPIPDDTILDDVVIPMQCLIKKHTVTFEPSAVAIDPQPASVEFETRRKIRTLAGNWQMLFRHVSWLFPWTNRSCIQLISHKYLRLIGPYLMGAACVANLLLDAPAYRVLLGIQAAIYLIAAIGLAFPKVNVLPIRLPATFVYLNWLNAAALPAWVTGVYRHGWQKKL